MTTNQNLIAKADIALADLTANGGQLPTLVASNFIRRLIKTPTILAQARVIEMPSGSWKAPRIQFANRILRKATQGVALTQAQRSSPVTTEIALNAKEVIAEVQIPYDVMEEAVEQSNLNLTAAQQQGNNANVPTGGIRDTIVELIAERAAVDLEELGLLGDTTYTSGNADDQAYLSMFDGFLKRANRDGNVVDNGGASVGLDMFKTGMKALPDPYHRNKVQMRNYLSVDQEINYRASLGTRETGLGDDIINSNRDLVAYGVPVESVMLMPDTVGLLTHPKNLIFGIRRKVNLEFDKLIQSRVYIIVLTARIDVQLEEERAVVEYTNIGTA